MPHADAGVQPAQRGLREAGGGRHESQRHACQVQDRVQAPARVPQHPLPCEGHRLEGAYPGVHLRLRDVPPHGQALLHQHRVALRMPAPDDGVHRHQQRVAHTRPVPGVRNQEGGNDTQFSDERRNPPADGRQTEKRQAGALP